MTAVQPIGRFGGLEIDEDNNITQFEEKPQGDGKWVNGGFFVLEPEVLDLLKDKKDMLEKAPLENIARAGQLNAFHHHGFWMAMDKLSDKLKLEKMWNSGNALWKTWDE